VESGDHRLRERTSARRRGGRAASCVTSPWTLFLRYITMDVAAAVPTTFRPSIHSVESHTHTWRRFPLLFVYFSDSHRPALASPSLSTTTTTTTTRYNTTTVLLSIHTTTTTTTSRIRLPMLPWYTSYTAYRWRDGEKATTMIVRIVHR